MSKRKKQRDELFKKFNIDIPTVKSFKTADILSRIDQGLGGDLDSKMVGLKPKIEGDPADTLGTYGEQAFDRVKDGTGDMADSVKTFGSAIYQNIQEENKRKARTPEVLDRQIKQLEDLLLDYGNDKTTEEYKAISKKIIELKIEKITRMNNDKKPENNKKPNLILKSQIKKGN